MGLLEYNMSDFGKNEYKLIHYRDFAGNINPHVSGTYSIGTSGIPYQAIHAVSGYFESIKGPGTAPLRIQSGEEQDLEIIMGGEGSGPRVQFRRPQDNAIGGILACKSDEQGSGFEVDGPGGLWLQCPAETKEIRLIAKAVVTQTHIQPRESDHQAKDLGTPDLQFRCVNAVSGVFDAMSGGTVLAVRKIEGGTGPYAITSSDGFINADASSEAFTATLPDATTLSGRSFFIKKTDSSSNNVTVSGTQNIDGAVTFDLIAQYESIRVLSDGIEWWIV